MSSTDTDEFRTLLEQERERLTSAVGFLHDENPGTIEDELGEVGSGGTDNHLGDTASATFDRELDQGLEEGAQQTLDRDRRGAEADRGRHLRHLRGLRQADRRRIGLRAIPWAKLCIEDQRRVG